MRADFEVMPVPVSLLGEGALWDSQNACLLWVDIFGKTVGQLDPSTARHRVLPVDALVGTVVPTTRGDLLVALHAGVARLDRETGRVSDLVTPPGHDPALTRFNDGKCDPAGRFIAGTTSLSGQPHLGALYAFETGRAPRTLLTDVSISNGLTWSLDGTRFYYIDTPTRVVKEFAYDASTGTPSHPRVAIEIPEALGYPDGMTIDAESMLWVALWGGSGLTRWDPGTGRLLETRRLPVALVTSCALGGPNLDTLYVTSARADLSPAELAAQPLAGSLFALPANVPGIPANVYRG